MALQVGRQRLMVESAHGRELASGATLTPSLEVGVRNDTGDGETGTGVQVGGALCHENPASRLRVEGRVRSLVSHSDDTPTWMQAPPPLPWPGPQPGEPQR